MLPNDCWVRALIAPALVFIAACIDRNYQTDLWHHLARGRVIATEGRLLDEDRFTYTIAGKHFQDANWAWQVLHYELFRLGGLPLVQSFNALVLAVAMAVLVALCRRRSGSLSAAALACLLVFFGTWQLFLVRPQTFSLLFFVLLYACLEGASRRPRLLFVPPVIITLWANCHGGFPVGLALVGCYTLAAFLASPPPRFRFALASSHPNVLPWALCLGGCLLASCLSPYGWRVWEYVLLTSRTASGRRIDEWLPPGLAPLAGKVFVLSVVLLLGLLAWTPRRPTSAADRRRFWCDLCLVGCFLPAACGSVRMVAWWLLVVAPLLAERLADAWPALTSEGPELSRPNTGAALTVAGLALAMLVSLPWLERYNPVFLIPGRSHRTESDLQAAADRLSQAAPTGRLFTRFAWGEYLGWATAGNYRVFMDGRIEIFPDEVWAEYAALTRGRADWEEVLANRGVDCLLLDSASGYHGDLLPLVEKSSRWTEAFRQGDAVLFLRRAGADTAQALPPTPPSR